MVLKEKEEKVAEMFCSMCVWGNKIVWESLSIEDGEALLPDSNVQNSNELSHQENEVSIDILDSAETQDSNTHSDYEVVPGISMPFEVTENIAETNVNSGFIPIYYPEEDIDQMMLEIPQDDEVEDLHHMLQEARYVVENENVTNYEQYAHNEEVVADITELEASFEQISFCDTDDEEKNENIPNKFGFHKFSPPSLLTRHPPPAIGRDDNVNKLKEILSDILIKSAICKNPSQCKNMHAATEKVLCGPDQKIGSNLIKLIKSGNQFNHFLPEFPVLHLRKSHITILFSSYKTAGLLELLQFMKDEDQNEWIKLLSIEHIDVATNNVMRLSVAFHTALLAKFRSELNAEESSQFLDDLNDLSESDMALKWNKRYASFIDNNKKNATFALHVDMMNHCDQVIGLSLCERIGGSHGYSLLTSIVKSSLPFLYVNGGSSYAPSCTELLRIHSTCGKYYQHFKETMYTTPIRNSNRNFACDTKREIEHRDVTKSFGLPPTPKQSKHEWLLLTHLVMHLEIPM